MLDTKNLVRRIYFEMAANPTVLTKGYVSSGMSKFDNYFRHTSAILQNEYERSSGFEHSGTAGGAREYFVERFLNEIYPEKFVFGDGEIIDSDGRISDQADLVIYDEHLPVLEYGSSKHFLSAGVMAHIEVKTGLSSQLESALSKVDSVKQLNSDVEPFIWFKGTIPDQIYSCIFAYEGPQKSTFKKNVQEYYSHQENAGKSADLICVLGKYIMYKEATPTGEELVFLETGDDSLKRFFVNLAEAVFTNYVRGCPDIQKYTGRNQAEQF